MCDLNGCSIHIVHFVTSIKGTGLFRCDIQCSSTSLGGRKGRGVHKDGSLDRLYTEEKERLRKTKRDKYLKQYAVLIQ